AAGRALDLVGYLDSILAQSIYCLCKIVDAETNVINNPALCGRHLFLILPVISIDLPRIGNRVNYDVHVVHRKRRAGSDWNIAIRPRGHDSARNSEVLCVPIACRMWVLAEHMYVAKTMVLGSVQFDERAIGPFDIGIVKQTCGAGIAAADVADVSQRREELRPAVELFLICGFHVFGAPAE